MEHKIKLGAIGTHIRMKLIREIMPKRFPELQVDIYEYDRYDYDERMIRELQDIKAQVDGVIFGESCNSSNFRSCLSPIFHAALLKKTVCPS